MLIYLTVVESAKIKVKKEAFNLSQFNFLSRSLIKDALRTFALQISQNLQTNNLQEIIHEMNGKIYKFFAKVVDDYVCLACIEDYYPADLIDAVLDMCVVNDLNHLIKEYKDYKKHDHIELISKEIEETKVILSRTLETVFNRGENLSGLSENAEKLEIKSRQLFQKAKNQNKKCC